MLRITTLSLLLILSIGVVLPFGNSAHGLRQNTQVGARRYRHHSRAWWRRYRARIRARRAAVLAHRNAMLALPQNVSIGSLLDISTPTPAAPAPSFNAPNSAEPPVMTPAAKRSVTLPGQLNLAVVALARPNPAFLTAREESRMLAGMNVSEFRRIVIDKMLTAGGWVTNDFVREVNGARVFIVTARTPREANTPEKAWTFYFTEAGGRVYGLTTDTPVEYADQMSNEAERLINSLQSQNNR